jgi:hypothetical protein
VEFSNVAVHSHGLHKLFVARFGLRFTYKHKTVLHGFNICQIFQECLNMQIKRLYFVIFETLPGTIYHFGKNHIPKGKAAPST